MTNVSKTAKKTVKSETAHLSTKSEETLLKDAKERVMRMQDKKKKPLSSKKNTIKTTNKSVKTVKRRAKNGVVYIGHLPHGFFEEELRSFFSQFGEVARVKVSRSRKTGQSKGYAFVEFHHDDVAKIVAQTMNNYLMFERLLKAQYIPPEKVHSKMFPTRWITATNYPTLVRRKRILRKQDRAKPASAKKLEGHRSRCEYKVIKAMSKLKEMGIDYQPQIFDPLAIKKLSDNAEVQHKDDSMMNQEEIPKLVPIETSQTTKKQAKAPKRVVSMQSSEKKIPEKKAKLIVEAVVSPKTVKDSPKPIKPTEAKTLTAPSKLPVAKPKPQSSQTVSKSVPRSTNPESQTASSTKEASESLSKSSTAKSEPKSIKAGTKQTPKNESKPEPKSEAKALPKPTKVQAKPSQKPAKVPIKSSTASKSSPQIAKSVPKPVAKQATEPKVLPKPAPKTLKAPATVSPKTEKAKPKSMAKEVTAQSKLAVRSVKGKKAV